MKHRLASLILITVAVLALSSCASTLPQQIPDALNSACDAGTKAKPLVIEGRAQIITHWNDKIPGTETDLFSAETKAKLQDIDRNVLPRLDRALTTVCAAAEAINTLGGSTQKFDLNQALDVVFKAASFALEMKAKGAF